MAFFLSSGMARAYSNDLRRKFLQAYDEGAGTLEELAEQFRVSWGWAKKISARRTRTGEVDARPYRHGPVSRVSASVQEWIGEQIRAQSDLTLRELQERLEGQKRMRLSIGRIWLALRQLGLPLKKNRSTPKNKIPSKRSGAANSGEKRSVRWQWSG